METSMPQPYSRIMKTGRFTMFLAFAFCLGVFPVKSQLDGCSVSVIQLEMCFAQRNRSMVIDKRCCEALQQVVEAGFYCLCSLALTSPFSSLSNHLALSLPNCFISLPPLSLCEVLNPKPVLLTPDRPKEIIQPPPAQEGFVTPSTPPRPPPHLPPVHDVQVKPANKNSTTVSGQPLGQENNPGHAEPCVINEVKDTKLRGLELLCCIWVSMLVLVQS